MDYRVAYYEDSWPVDRRASTTDIVKEIINNRDTAIAQMRVPGDQEANIDHVSCGIWLKFRTDHPKDPGQTTTGFVSVKDRGLHRPVPFSFIREQLAETQIRLIELLPGTRNEPLRAILHSFDLEKAPAFYALSYVWSDQTYDYTILFENHRFGGERISSNLYAALEKVRQPDTSCFIWVDALCIDQWNMEEKSRQVAMMGTIFASAAQVTVWLDGKAFDENPPWKSNPPEVVRQGLIDILDRRWFHRMWTVQEAALSSRKTVMLCAEGSGCEWSATSHVVSRFIRGLKFAAVTADWNENGFSGSEALGLKGIDLTGIINLLGQQLQQIHRRNGIKEAILEPDLLDIAYEVKNKLSSDPRDRLYAILGLAEIRGSNKYYQLRPDYQKTLHEVQEDFRQILLEAAKNEKSVGGSDTTNLDVNKLPKHIW